MSKLLQDLAEIAKENLKRDGYLVPLFMWFREGKFLIDPQIMAEFKGCNAEDAKTRNVFVAGALAHKLQADQVVFIWDAAFRIVDPKQEYDETEAPLSYPKSMRTECIVVCSISLPSGKEETVMVPYKGGDGEPVEFLPNDFSKGAEIKTRFTEIILEGWNKYI
jgi:hypothetical protein